MKKASLIIPVFNRVDITREGLRLLFKTLSTYNEAENGLSFEVVVVDDGSTDGTSDMIEKDYPEVHLLHGTGNLWWSGATNMGSKYAIKKLNSDYIVLWNDDTYMNDDYFSNLSKILVSDTSDNIYGSYIFEYPNQDKVWATGGYFNKFLGVRKTHRNINNDRQNQWFTGMGTIIPAKVVLNLNYWDDVNFPQYFGDIDFTLKAYNSGVKLITKTELKLWNKVEYSSFIAKKTWADYFKSLRMIQSRYNIKKEAMFLRRFSTTPLWIVYFTYRQIKYLSQFLKKKYLRID